MMNDIDFKEEIEPELVATIYANYFELSGERKIRFLKNMTSWINDEMSKL